MANRTPEFSIIMPVFNSEMFISESINSVLNQTFKDFELICINDNTSDKAFETCKDLKEKDERIICIDSNHNVGQGESRNKGLKIAKGNYVLFLDSDDLLETTALESLHFIISKNKPDCVLFSFENFYEDKTKKVLSLEDDKSLLNNAELKIRILNGLSHDIISCIGNKAYKMSLIKDNNLCFSNKYRYNEDVAFSLNVLEKCNTIYLLNKALYKYRRRLVGSTMTSYRKDLIDTIVPARLNYLNLITIEKNDKLNESSQKTSLVNVFIGCFYDCLKNEKKFANKESFKHVIEKIINLDIFKFVVEYSKCNKKSFPLKKRLFLRFVNHQNDSLLWSLIK